MKVFVVVGTGRSATSLVAKGLHDNDVSMGRRLLGASPSNPWGHFEDRQVIAINDRILEAAGGCWHDPPPHDAIAAVETDEPAAYVASRTGPLWGMKDPRLSLTWPLWLPHLTGDVHVIWARRHPRQVALSLQRRDGTPVDVGMRLAKVYERRILMFQDALYGGT